MGNAGEEVQKHRLCSRKGALSTLLKAILPIRRRLLLDPKSKLYFPYEPGKQVRSAVKIINTSRSNVAFKFQTTAPKSCFMRPPTGMLAPGESVIATGISSTPNQVGVNLWCTLTTGGYQPPIRTSVYRRFGPRPLLGVWDKTIWYWYMCFECKPDSCQFWARIVFKFVEPPEETKDNQVYGKRKNTKDKFKIVSLKVKSEDQFSKEMFEEQKETIIVEQILKVIFLDPNTPSSALEKLNNQLAEAEAQAPKKSPKPSGVNGDSLPSDHKGPAIDQWKERRRRYIAEHQGEIETTKQPSAVSEE